MIDLGDGDDRLTRLTVANGTKSVAFSGSGASIHTVRGSNIALEKVFPTDLQADDFLF